MQGITAITVTEIIPIEFVPEISSEATRDKEQKCPDKVSKALALQIYVAIPRIRVYISTISLSILSLRFISNDAFPEAVGWSASFPFETIPGARTGHGHLSEFGSRAVRTVASYRVFLCVTNGRRNEASYRNIKHT